MGWVFSLEMIKSVSLVTPEPGFEPESEAPQAPRISKLPHSGRASMIITE